MQVPDPTSDKIIILINQIEIIPPTGLKCRWIHFVKKGGVSTLNSHRREINLSGKTFKNSFVEPEVIIHGHRNVLKWQMAFQ